MVALRSPPHIRRLGLSVGMAMQSAPAWPLCSCVVGTRSRENRRWDRRDAADRHRDHQGARENLSRTGRFQELPRRVWPMFHTQNTDGDRYEMLRASAAFLASETSFLLFSSDIRPDRSGDCRWPQAEPSGRRADDRHHAGSDELPKSAGAVRSTRPGHRTLPTSSPGSPLNQEK